jgi:hypothetical protein
LYGSETWSLTLGEEHRLRVLKNRVLRKISGPKRDDVTAEWRRLHNQELYDLQSSPNTIRVIKSRTTRWARHVACMGDMRGTYNVLMWRSDGTRPLGRPKRRWDDNIKMYLQALGGEGTDWIDLVQGKDR